MTSRLRRLVGSVGLIAFLTVWVFFALSIGDVIAATKPGWVQFVYFVIAGLLWVPPAGVIVKWMYTPPRPKA